MVLNEDEKYEHLKQMLRQVISAAMELEDDDAKFNFLLRLCERTFFYRHRTRNHIKYLSVRHPTDRALSWRAMARMMKCAATTTCA